MCTRPRSKFGFLHGLGNAGQAGYKTVRKFLLRSGLTFLYHYFPFYFDGITIRFLYIMDWWYGTDEWVLISSMYHTISLDGFLFGSHVL